MLAQVLIAEADSFVALWKDFLSLLAVAVLGGAFLFFWPLRGV
jgi:hypothetical protein